MRKLKIKQVPTPSVNELLGAYVPRTHSGLIPDLPRQTFTVVSPTSGRVIGGPYVKVGPAKSMVTRNRNRNRNRTGDEIWVGTTTWERFGE